jgi:hypothetical protein
LSSSLDSLFHVAWSVVVVAVAFGVIGVVLVALWFGAAVLGSRSARLKYQPEVLD